MSWCSTFFQNFQHSKKLIQCHNRLKVFSKIITVMYNYDMFLNVRKNLVSDLYTITIFVYNNIQHRTFQCH